MHSVVLVAAAFLASAVEMVEALTIRPRGGRDARLRSAGWGVAAALGGLVVIVAGLGPALANLPIDSMRLVVGAVLLVFGLQWLRKAILRASGLKALHDEEAIYEAEVAHLRAGGQQPAHDWYAFTVAFQRGVPRGLGGGVHRGHVRRDTKRNVGLAAVGAGAALVVVLIAG